MKNFNKAFTLTELLVALGVIAILCAVLLPLIFNLMPNQNTVMAKRGYYMLQSVISELLNDEACYPDKSNSSTNKKVGFDDGFGYANCRKWGGEENTNTIETEGNQGTKFLTLFKDKLNITEDSGDSFQTSEGIFWNIGNSTSLFSSSSGTADIILDVNGVDAPNCGQNSQTSISGGTQDENCSKRTSGFDIFTTRVHADGKIEIIDEWAKDAVKINKNITE